MKSTNAANLEILDDFSVLVSGPTPETDIYEIQLDLDKSTEMSALRLEALTDARLPSQGPGRTPHGNFVLSEITASVSDSDQASESRPVKFQRATADFSQKSYPVENAVDGDISGKSGWAIATESGRLNVNRTASFFTAEPIANPSGKLKLTVRLLQNHSGHHTLGKFRLSFGYAQKQTGQTEAESRRAHFQQKYEQWRTLEFNRLATWTPLRPIAAVGSLPLLTILDDGSILASGDQSKRDTYQIGFENRLANITALRIEVMPDPSLPRNGPGRVYYEGPFGDFFLSEVGLSADQNPVKLVHASHSYASGLGAPACLDGNQQTGWSIDGGQGRPHVAVFRFEKPLPQAQRLDLTLLFERYYAAGLGRFRVSVTDDSRPVEASPLPVELESLVRQSTSESPPPAELIRYFCRVAPELAAERRPIIELEAQATSATTALVMQERPASNPRQTRRYHRGEFLNPKEPVTPAGLSMLPPLSPAELANRLALAKWLVGRDNPLSSRVTANRHWSILFGRGIVRTIEDFGSQGVSPTHPELLDWLSVELAGRTESRSPRDWSMKRFHRMLASSTTYRQSSRVTPQLLAKDPPNELYARGPRFRLDAELVRDMALHVSGVLSDKVGGPSVFPPQPKSVTTEGTYGAFPWNVSPGEDRYRRSLYTFSKRTSPYAMFMTFDGPSGESCIARREVTNTPLQALTMLNDTIIVEAAQILGQEFAASTEPESDRLQHMFRRCLTRPVSDDELRLLKHFFNEQSGRLERNELDASAIAGPGESPRARAAWTLVARALLNLDEAITRD